MRRPSLQRGFAFWHELAFVVNSCDVGAQAAGAVDAQLDHVWPDAKVGHAGDE